MAYGCEIDRGKTRREERRSHLVHFFSRPEAMVFTALMVSVQVGLIRASGNRKPKWPVSRNSKAKVYGIPFL